MLKIEKICMLNTNREYLVCLQPDASSSFLESVSFVEQGLKFSHFEGALK